MTARQSTGSFCNLPTCRLRKRRSLRHHAASAGHPANAGKQSLSTTERAQVRRLQRGAHAVLLLTARRYLMASPAPSQRWSIIGCIQHERTTLISAVVWPSPCGRLMDCSSVLRPYSCYLIVECQSLLVSDLTNVSPICIAQWCADVEPEVGATFVETMRLVQLAGGEAVPVTFAGAGAPARGAPDDHRLRVAAGHEALHEGMRTRPGIEPRVSAVAGDVHPTQWGSTGPSLQPAEPLQYSVLSQASHSSDIGGGAALKTRGVVLQDPVLRRQLNKDTRINLASAGLFTASDYVQVCSFSGSAT